MANRHRTINNVPSHLKNDATARGQVDDLYKHRLADNSSAKYQGPWNAYVSWLRSIGISNPLNLTVVTDHVIVYYLGHIVATAKERKVGEQVINTTMAAIRYFYINAGLSSPTESPIVFDLRQAVPRMLIDRERQRCVPLTACQLLLVLERFLLPSCNLRVRMHLTIYLLMFVGLFRYSDVAKILVHEELFQFRYKNNVLIGLLLFIPWSKTDQSHDGAWVAIGATGKTFCPVKLLKTLLQFGQYKTSHPSEFVGPLLRATARHNANALQQITSSFDKPIQPLSYQALLKSIQSMVEEATGIHTALHGPRKGGASTAAEIGIESQLICSLGRWKFGNTFEDTYLTMLDGNAQRFFDLTSKIWPY